MRTRRTANHRRPFALALGLAAFLIFGALAQQSRAGLVIKVLDSSASAGGTGSFDVILTNEGGQDSFLISGFSVKLSVDDTSGVKFTGVTDGTSDAYIFGTQQNAPFTTDPLPGTTFTGSDSDFRAPGFIELAAGQTVGLLHVSYEVAAGTAAGRVIVEIMNSGGTELNDANSDPLSYQSINGAITINGGPVVPEPASFIALATAAALLPIPALVRRTRRKNG